MDFPNLNKESDKNRARDALVHIMPVLSLRRAAQSTIATLERFVPYAPEKRVNVIHSETRESSTAINTENKEDLVFKSTNVEKLPFPLHFAVANVEPIAIDVGSAITAMRAHLKVLLLLLLLLFC
jgi:hypothetical protein